MAEEKKATVKKAADQEASKGSKFINWCKKLPQRIAKPFRNMWNEVTKRVTWPTKRKLIIYSCVVLVFMLCMGIIIGAIDLGASALVRALGGVL